ncbi:hypothetical protein AB1207_08510 [Kineococcus endophyticus]|uniref:DUF1579 domain-containing protein n=1 Tax=Kineococcus endophyticus TaxID=1181883 RepID=A0ABV3P586_9ACTN
MSSSADRAGTWTGENAFRLLADDAPHPAPATAVVQVSGAMTTVAYTWEHPDDGPQAGLLALGPADGTPDAGPVVALWGDSWHQAPEARVLTGRVHEDGTVVVAYDYAEGRWRWEVALASDADALALRMDNVPLADGERHTAMTATFTRA